MPAVHEAILVGLGLGFSLAAPPGPVMAKIAFETAHGRWRHGILVGFGATTADAVYFLAVSLGLVSLVPSDRTLGTMALAGAALMLFFAYGAWRAARRPLEARPSPFAAYPAGFVLAITSPFNLAFWLTSGAPILHEYGFSLGLGFFAALIATVFVAVSVFHQGARRIARFETYVSYASAFLLAGFALLLAWKGYEGLSG